MNKLYGIIFCAICVIPCWLLGNMFPIIGAPIIAILSGMIIAIFVKDKGIFATGIKYTSKKILQLAVIFLGFGLNLMTILETGKQSLPIIVATILTSLGVAYIVYKLFKVDSEVSILVGVGSSICGGSAIAATAPVIKADDRGIAQAMSIVFFFNVVAALVFPTMGEMIGFDTTSGEAFGIFAGTAVNDTSSVTATASTWDSMWGLGSATLDKAVIVKLTRTLAIIPIVVGLSIYRQKKEQKVALKNTQQLGDETAIAKEKINILKLLPTFIILFILASVVTTVVASFGIAETTFAPAKIMSKYMIAMAMFAIGLETDIVHLIKTGGKPLMLGAFCWVSITAVCILMQKLMGLL
ncbi:MAG: putative sulfate exporter family transporter [Eubacteriales bacterium]|nr:putative sulfate exporter family transporter [Eubacteriales bacterium]MDY3332552.1 putative sulfate exporter family transporter [Gallibacter sp.]